MGYSTHTCVSDFLNAKRDYYAIGDGIADDTAALQAAATAAEDSILFLPKGRYRVSSTLTLPTGLHLMGAGRDTALEWIGGAGPALLIGDGKTRVEVESLQLHTIGSAGIAIKLDGCTDCLIDNLFIAGEADATGFSTGIQITKSGSTTPFQNRISRLFCHNPLVTGISLDNAVETTIDHSTIYGIADSIDMIALLVDSGVSGVYANVLSTGKGKNGLKVQHTLGGNSPRFLFFDQFLADTFGGGDGILFDASIGAALVDATFVNCWSAASGRAEDLVTQITVGANGVTLRGGQHLSFLACRVRVNDANGFAITNANVREVTIDNCRINANNYGNNADGQGVYVSAAANEVKIRNNYFWNFEEGILGHQKFALKCAAVAATNLVFTGNECALMESGDISNANTASQLVALNNPLSDITFRSGAADPTAANIHAGGSLVWKNTVANEVRVWVNDGGVMKKSAAFT